MPWPLWGAREGQERSGQHPRWDRSRRLAFAGRPRRCQALPEGVPDRRRPVVEAWGFRGSPPLPIGRNGRDVPGALT
ncbi:MAG: hypothetical protein ACKO3N_13105, partial [Verrucomicrobiota bacterium]